jgi:hypothetical protein
MGDRQDVFVMFDRKVYGLMACDQRAYLMTSENLGVMMADL